jgi:uncharacterized membrane protein
MALLSMVSLVVGSTLAGFQKSMELIIESGLGSALLIFLFIHHLKET